jgi:hypothetical protein
MNKKYILNIGILILLFLISSCSKNLVYNSIKSNSACSKKNGYWYNNKCWKDFEDEGISEAKIDSTVIAQMKIIDKSKVKINNQTFPLTAFMPIEEKEGMLFIAVFGDYENYKTLLFPTEKKKMKSGTFESPVIYFKGNAMSDDIDENDILAAGTSTVNVLDIDNVNIEIKGKVVNKDSTLINNFAFTANESVLGAGSSHLEIKGKEAYLSGDLGTITYTQIKDLIKNHPEIKTIVMTNISGSVNDAVNMHTGRLLHENGFTTKVLSNSDIASGGVDLFCAGVNRIVEKGAKIGVHSWCCVNDLTAIELPKDHPAHQYQLEYFTMALGPKNGPAFYFYTLEAAPFDDVHYMTDDEIKEWKIATKFIENE